MSGDHLQSPDADEKELTAVSLHLLKASLSSKPHEEKSVFAHVQRIRPDLVNDDHMLKFLRVDDFDVDVSLCCSVGMNIISTCMHCDVILCIALARRVPPYNNPLLHPSYNTACSNEVSKVLGVSRRGIRERPICPPSHAEWSHEGGH